MKMDENKIIQALVKNYNTLEKHKGLYEHYKKSGTLNVRSFIKEELKKIYVEVIGYADALNLNCNQCVADFINRLYIQYYKHYDKVKELRAHMSENEVDNYINEME